MNKLLSTNYIIILFSLFFSLQLDAQEDYLLTIDGKTINIALNKVETVLINGKEVEVNLNLKDTLSFDQDLFAFNYLKEYSVTQTTIEIGIDQIMIMSADGTGIMIQQYKIMNPSMLRELMLSEVTKESVTYGYDLQREDYTRKLKDGSEIEVLKAVLKYRETESIYEIAALGEKDEGILIITMKPDINFSTQNDKIIDVMWNSILYK